MPKEELLREKIIKPTDPEAGMLKTLGKLVGSHYLSYQSVDTVHRTVVDAAVALGNINDSGPYLERIEYMHNHLG